MFKCQELFKVPPDNPRLKIPRSAPAAATVVFSLNQLLPKALLALGAEEVKEQAPIDPWLQSLPLWQLRHVPTRELYIMSLPVASIFCSATK